MMIRRKRLGLNARRALEMLADDPRGFPETVLVAHGFADDLLRMLIRARLVQGQIDPAEGGREIEVIRLRITEAGRQALEADPKRRRPQT